MKRTNTQRRTHALASASALLWSLSGCALDATSSAPEAPSSTSPEANADFSVTSNVEQGLLTRIDFHEQKASVEFYGSEDDEEILTVVRLWGDDAVDPTQGVPVHHMFPVDAFEALTGTEAPEELVQAQERALLAGAELLQPLPEATGAAPDGSAYEIGGTTSAQTRLPGEIREPVRDFKCGTKDWNVCINNTQCSNGWSSGQRRRGVGVYVHVDTGAVNVRVRRSQTSPVDFGTIGSVVPVSAGQWVKFSRTIGNLISRYFQVNVRQDSGPCAQYDIGIDWSNSRSVSLDPIP